MKIKLNIEFEDCKVIGDIEGVVSGEVCFDEFGIITETNVNSSSLGKDKKGKKNAKKILKGTADRVRADLLRNFVK
jgi:hypothetical protein